MDTINIHLDMDFKAPLCQILFLEIPHLKKKLMRFGKEYADSRIYGGYHYPSDNLVSNKIVDYFFKKKYHKNLEKNIKQKYY